MTCVRVLVLVFIQNGCVVLRAMKSRMQFNTKNHVTKRAVTSSITRWMLLTLILTSFTLLSTTTQTNPEVRADSAAPLYGARTLSDGFVPLLPTRTKTASIGTQHPINNPIVPTAAPTNDTHQTTPQDWISDFLFSKYALWGSFTLATGFITYHFADQLCAFLLR